MNKVWQFIKKYWYIFAIIVISIISLIFFRKSSLLESLINSMKDSYDRQIAEIERLNKKEKEEKEAIQKKYDETIKLLEEKYKQDNKVLEEAKKDKVKELIELYNKDPNTLTERLKEEFNL